VISLALCARDELSVESIADMSINSQKLLVQSLH